MAGLMGEVVRLPMAAWLHGASEGRQGLSRRKTSISLAFPVASDPRCAREATTAPILGDARNAVERSRTLLESHPKIKISIFPPLHIQQPDAALPHLSRSVPATTQ